MLTYKQSIEQKILEAFLLLNNKDCYSKVWSRTTPQPFSRPALTSKLHCYLFHESWRCAASYGN